MGLLLFPSSESAMFFTSEKLPLHFHFVEARAVFSPVSISQAPISRARTVGLALLQGMCVGLVSSTASSWLMSPCFHDHHLKAGGCGTQASF